MSGLLQAVKNQEFGSTCELQNRILTVEAEPFDCPIQSPDYKNAKRHDLYVRSYLASAPCVEKEFIPVLGIGSAQRPVRLFQRFGKLAVDPDVSGCEIAVFQQGNQMCFDGQPNLAPMRDIAGVSVRFFDCFKNPQQPEMEHLIENLLFGIEVVIDASGFDLSNLSDLAQSRGRVALATK